mmetsp:Transcript_12869/g.30091  ORF Transcript_12869/g.30091 Transcript_12869/m.30091 type:complete len:1061 (+) Transcript_12869:204-3386(+)
MRQIITQNTWSSNPSGNNGSRYGSTASLNTMESSSGRGDTESSFEVPNVSSNPYRRKTQNSNEMNGSMQFVPADHEVENKFVSTHETSWDALASDSSPNHNLDQYTNSAARSVVTPSPPSGNRMPGRSSSFLRKARQQQQNRFEKIASPVSPSAEDNQRTRSKMTRLASMFSSRAEPVVVPLRASSPVSRNTNVSPPSPPRSEASSGYVGWPGTQDKQGATVVAESSFEESDASIGNQGGSAQNSTHSHSLPSCPGDDQDKIHRLAMPRKFPDDSRGHIVMEQFDNDAISDVSASYSKTSSAYFSPGEVQAIRKGNTEQLVANQKKNRLAASTVMRRCLSSSVVRQQQQSQPLTEETLAMKDHFSPPARAFNNAASTGYRGLLDKTQEVPNLMDETASDTTSAVSAATSKHSSPSYYRHQQEREQRPRHYQRVTTIDEGDGTEIDLKGNNYVANNVQISQEYDGYDARGANVSSTGSTDDNNDGFLGARSRTSMEKLNLALLGGGLTTIQTTTDDFTNRMTARDFDESLSDSDCDQDGFTRIPAFDEMIFAGRNHHDRALSCQSLQFASATQSMNRNQNDRSGVVSNHYQPMTSDHSEASGDFNQYYIDPERMQVLVKKFRKMSLANCKHLDHEDLEREEDATKAFALSEMRSRIMETDIERGLERRGGTTVVDDIVLTSYYRAALRVRDAVIVAKAWRDGATPQDIVTTSKLTRRDERSYYIPRWNGSGRGPSKYTWEEVNWLDDSELSQYRCHSIGPRHLKGVEMFTIGDCQSILLKLSYERCNELRAELDEATTIQIQAEAAMKAEGETFDGMMTEAEMTYLTSMEQVKSVSQKLVLAEKSFALVKNRIEKLVAKYEALLVHFENETESVAPSSVFSYESSCYSDYSFAAAKIREDETLARRAERAELRAELAARESMMTNQDTNSVYQEKAEVVNNLKVRIADLQSESSAAITDRDRSVVLARALRRGPSGGNEDATGRSRINDIKQRFRDRSAAKSKGNIGTASAVSSSEMPSSKHAGPSGNKNEISNFHRTVGEEMFQHLDFYERSLNAVKRHR